MDWSKSIFSKSFQENLALNDYSLAQYHYIAAEVSLLEESLRVYEEGIEAYRRCQEKLRSADIKVRKLVEALDGELEEKPFEMPDQETSSTPADTEADE
jgi:hypothetical protein